jgi:hypothetical protein
VGGGWEGGQGGYEVVVSSLVARRGFILSVIMDTVLENFELRLCHS